MNLKHIAIIMDGNGRWAKRRGLPRSEGHRRGAEAARRVTRAARKMGLPCLTLYALSTENLYRPQAELDALSNLLRGYLKNEVPSLIENNIRLKILGDRAGLPADMRRLIEEAERDTAADFRMTLCLAVIYGGRDDIVRAARKALAGKKPETLTEDMISNSLDTAGLPDPDLVIRTGGDYRLSNFLLWQAAYSELYFTARLWPDFGARELKAAIASFERRERRFGETEKTGPRRKGRLK